MENVYATDVTVANTFGDATYGYTNNDFLTKTNYDNYFNVSEDYIKYCVNAGNILNNGDSDYGSHAVDVVLNNITNLNDTEFPDVSGKKVTLFTWWRSTYSCYLYNLVVDGSDDISFVNGIICSKSQFTIKQYIYSCGSGSISGTYTRYTGEGFGYDIIDDTPNIQYDSVNQIYYRNFGGMLFYSEVPVLFTYSPNASYPAGDYLASSPYSYASWQNVYNAYANDTDDTGFVIDRRTEHMINESTGGSSVNPSQYGFKQNSFGNILYGDNTTNQYLMVGYELNDASKSIGDKLYLKLNYRYLFSGQIHGVPISFDETYYDNVNRYDLYPLNNNNYINVDLSNKIFPLLLETDSTFETNYATLRDVWEFSNSGANSPYAQKPVPVSCDQMLYDFTTEHILTGYSMPVEYDTNFFNSVSLSYKGVTVSPTFNINTLWDGEFNSTYENRIDSAQVIVTESIYNVETGEESSPCTFIYDYLYGTYEGIGTLETIGEQLPSDKYTYGGQSLGYSSKEIGYNLATGDFYSSSAGGSSSASGNVVNVYAGASSTGKVLIDIPFETAIANTPNLKQMYEDLKSGFVLSTTNSQSIIQLTRDTYTFIPAEIWGYIAITVVTCCGLAVYRNFRGR